MHGHGPARRRAPVNASKVTTMESTATTETLDSSKSTITVLWSTQITTETSFGKSASFAVEICRSEDSRCVSRALRCATFVRPLFCSPALNDRHVPPGTFVTEDWVEGTSARAWRAVAGLRVSRANATMVKLTAELVALSPQFTNTLKDRELDLRGPLCPCT